MAGLMKLDAQKAESTIGLLSDGYNKMAIEYITEAATALKGIGEENEIVAQGLEACKKFQEQYNTNLESVTRFIDETGKVFDIAEFMEKRANVGEVKARDVSFAQNKIDPGVII